MAKVSIEKAKAAGKSLTKFWKAGQDYADWRRQRLGSAWDGTLPTSLTRKFKRLAARKQLNPDSLDKAYRFAKAYTEKHVRRFCEQILERQAPFGKAHAIRAMAVPEESRTDWINDAISNCWSFREFDAAALKRFGRERAGGRKQRFSKLASSPRKSLRKITEEWRQFLKMLRRPNERADKEVFPKELISQSLAIYDEMKQLLTAINRCKPKPE
jgi:hypothetical protein